MTMELMLSHDFIKELTRELEFDQGAHRHTADLNNGNDIEISVDVSTRCHAPSTYAVSWGLRWRHPTRQGETSEPWGTTTCSHLQDR